MYTVHASLHASMFIKSACNIEYVARDKASPATV